jgi:ATP-dependent DNA helicase RecG
VFVRQGASTVPARKPPFSHDPETGGGIMKSARSLVQQLSFEKTGEYFKKHGLEFGEAQKRTLGLIGEDGNYTNLAFLLSEQCTHTLRWRCLRQRKSVFKDRRELTDRCWGSSRGLRKYRPVQPHPVRLDGLERIDLRDYPPEAVRRRSSTRSSTGLRIQRIDAGQPV